MKLLFVLLPLLGCTLGLAQDLQHDGCVATCPPPNCPAGGALEACKCLNDREYACEAKCPEYIPRIMHCPRLPGSTTSAPEPAPQDCVCEEVFCVLSFPEGCYCRNNATKACFEKCGGEEPMYQDCSLPDVEVRALMPEPILEPEAASQAETCVCEDIMCIQSWPDSCYCRNDADRECFEKCGGVEPVYQNCSSLVNVETRASMPEPVPEPEACVCASGPFSCLQVWPDSCYCDYNIKKACSDKCGGPAPPFPTHCPPLNPPEIKVRVAEPRPVPASAPPPTCECPLVNCIASWPESCYCQNGVKERCYQRCGGEKPILQVCPPYPSSTFLTVTITPVPLPVPIDSHQATPTHQVCGGGRTSQVLDCPAGQVCITDPFQPGSCGPACDQLGICVGEKLCGGFAGFACENPDQVCIDDPRDDCDPLNGGSDCGGLCVWPQ